MFVELHMIQNFAPSNLNRDDTNTPKDCEFGGVRRARISSQCIKRAIRTSKAFEQAIAVDSSTRTRWLVRLLKSELVKSGKADETAEAVAYALAAEYAGKMDGDRTSVLLYLSSEEVRMLAQMLLERWEAILAGMETDAKGKPKPNAAIAELVKDLIKATRDRTSAPDIALFGRMLADKPELSLDAACQVAHAISTHRVNMEMDFFTAVDDLQQRDEAGAGMMGITGFNSATFYRYARVDWDQLVKNLSGDVALARKAVEGFLRASVAAVPTGKQNTFAAQNPPSFLLGVVRGDGMSWSLANAFEKPVQTRNAGLVEPSIRALDDYWGRLAQTYGNSDQFTVTGLALESSDGLSNLAGNLASDLDGWVMSILAALPQGNPA